MGLIIIIYLQVAEDLHKIFWFGAVSETVYENSKKFLIMKKYQQGDLTMFQFQVSTSTIKLKQKQLYFEFYFEVKKAKG